MIDKATVLLAAACLLALCRGDDCNPVGCMTGRNLRQEAHWISLLVVDETLCAKACRESSFPLFAVVADEDCFCAHQHHHHMMEGSDNCQHMFHSVDCVKPRPKSSHNLCPDTKRFYCQTKHKVEDRINNFMSYMTLDDKIQTMGQKSVAGKYYDKTPLVARDYVWWNEALHGLMPNHEPNGACGKVCPTQFAEANALSCAWNSSLWLFTAQAISTEARAYFNERATNGLTFYAPQINLASHPLWGRVMETPGEDPYLTSVFANQYITGLQGNNRHGIIQAAATPKHFLGHFYEGEQSDPWGNGTLVCRFSNDTRYSLQDLEQYYLPPFRAALKDAKAESLMCAYQSVNGVPMCGNGFLLNRVVRQEWNWKGFVVSDCDAIETMKNASRDWDNTPYHGYSPDAPSAVQDGIRAGCDQNCGDTYSEYGLKTVKEGRISEKQIDASIRRQLRTLFRMGLFDPREADPFADIGWKHVGTASHHQLALEGARQSIVLLQNGNGSSAAAVLPLNKSQRVLVAGPMFNATKALLGNYHGAACHNGTDHCLLSLEKALKLHVSSTEALAGVPAGCKKDTTGIAEVLKAAAQVDVVVLALGGICHEREGIDRDFLHLPGSQMDLFRALYVMGKPLAVVIINGGPFAIDVLKAAKEISIVQAGFPGQAGAQALAEVLVGDVNPSGKLTTTVYPASYANAKPMKGTPWMESRVRPREGSEGRSYMFYTGVPLFPFGYGLSYTTFKMQWEEEPVPLRWSYDELESRNIDGDFRVRVTNTGPIAGREVVQAYWSPPEEVDSQLVKQLFAFQAVSLDPGESSCLNFSIKDALKSMSTVTQFGDRVFRPGNYTVSFSRGHGQVLETITTVARYSLVRKFPSPWVEKHEVSLEACVEGTQEVIPHTERFLMAYKEWNWVPNHRWFSHPASKACLTFENKTKSVNLQTCEAANLEQKWIRRGGTIHPMVDRLLCLKPMARNSHQVRRPVFVSEDCATKWNLTDSGLLRSFVPEKGAPPEQRGLCLAARLEGRFNYKY